MKLKLLSVVTILLMTLSPLMADDFFEGVSYKGAFGPSNWAEGWTALEHYGFFTPTEAGKTVVTVTDADIPAGATVFWTADNVYLLDGRVFVDPGATLYIEAGTIVKGKPGTGESASALIVSRGAKIFAEGTATSPIIFTGQDDDVADPVDIPFDQSELWGGLIILGNAPINVAAGFNNIEGIPAEPRAEYGGPDADDNSGVLRYVSIRHGGIEIGEGNEINGLTMGGVGRGTTIDYVEVFSNKDDGFEWFGGTVNCKHLIAAFCKDDAFDHDEGLQCKMQFLFCLQGETTGDCCGEHDGAPSSDVAAEPKAYPVIYNATYLGSGKGGTSDGERVLRLRENWGGEYNNSIFGDYDGYGVTIEDKYEPDCSDRLAAGELLLKNNIWFDLAAGDAWDKVAKDGETWTADYLANAANGNTVENPVLNGISRQPNGSLDPRPQADGPAYQSVLANYPVDGFFETVNYKGAFGSTNWMEGWTAFDHYGFLKKTQKTDQVVTVTDNDIPAGANVYWTADKTYLLEGRVFVDPGATLNIEAGTVVKGKPGTGESASVLIVSRGAKIYAEGNGVNPIIFTGQDDDVTNPVDVPVEQSELWGGLIVLGNAPINVAAGVNNIEGIPAEPRAEYGGTEADDCSGLLRYISLRHGGIEIGEGNEINGLTMGGVGCGTTIDHVEVFANKDDGYEWFGGTVNCKHLIAVFCKDDAFDHDEGLQCQMQYLFCLQGETTGDHCGEHDGAPSSDVAAEPKAYPVIYNATYLGSGKTGTSDGERVLRLRENWGGEYNNSIFGDYDGYGVTIEDKYEPDCRDRLAAGELLLKNNIWFDLAAGDAWDKVAKEGETWTAEYLADPMNKNAVVNPQLKGISRQPNGGLDPRPATDGAAYKDEVTSVGYQTGVAIPNDYQLFQNYPNPFNPTTMITYRLAKKTNIKLAIFNLLGEELVTLASGEKPAGVHKVKFDASQLSTGLYFYRLEAGEQIFNKKLLLVK